MEQLGRLALIAALATALIGAVGPLATAMSTSADRYSLHGQVSAGGECQHPLDWTFECDTNEKTQTWYIWDVRACANTEMYVEFAVTSGTETRHERKRLPGTDGGVETCEAWQVVEAVTGPRCTELVATLTRAGELVPLEVERDAVCAVPAMQGQTVPILGQP